LWPNLIRQARRRNIPVLLLNGRISERSFRGYRRIRPFTESILRQFDVLCAQSESDARRLIELGAPADRVRVLGSAKYDLTPPDGEGRSRPAGC
jgi:3-deoxy-D-manno-octulosonic-acid transferase